MVRTGRAREQPCFSPSCAHTWLPCSGRAWDPLCLLVWFQRTKQERAPGTACCPQVSCVSLRALACRLLSPPPLPAPPPTPDSPQRWPGLNLCCKRKSLRGRSQKGRGEDGGRASKDRSWARGKLEQVSWEAQGGPGLGTVYEPSCF